MKEIQNSPLFSFSPKTDILKQRKRKVLLRTLGSCTVLETAGEGGIPMLYNVMESSGTSEPFTSSSSNEQVIWTSCSLDAIVQFLQKRDYDVVLISDDAGRFVCNYVYYHSL